MPGLKDAEQSILVPKNRYEPVPEWAKQLLEGGQSNHERYDSFQRQSRPSSQQGSSGVLLPVVIHNNEDEIKVDDVETPMQPIQGDLHS